MVKKDIEIQPGFEPGSSEFRSDALTNELLELWDWNEDRWHLSIDTVRLSGWISLRLGQNNDEIHHRYIQYYS